MSERFRSLISLTVTRSRLEAENDSVVQWFNPVMIQFSMSACVDPVVGKILAGWRYDISGLAPEMRGAYEAHFTECERCRSRRTLHRTIDVSLIVLASVSAGVFLLAFGVIHHFAPRHTLILELVALAGFALSALIWLIVAVATPAPMTVVDVARLGARHVHDRLPEEIRQRLPEELRMKLTGS